MHSPLSVFPPKKNPNMEKALFDWPIVLQYDVKAKYPLISGKFSGMKYFHPNVRLTNQKPRALYPFDKPIKLLYFRSFVVSVLFARFHQDHTKITLLFSRHCLAVLAPIYSLPCYSNTCLHCTKVWHAFVARNLSDMRRTLHFRGWHSAVSLCFGNCAEIISLLCVNRSSVRFSVRVGAKALWYIVNITLI